MFQKGYIPWNKDLKGYINSGSFKKGQSIWIGRKHKKKSKKKMSKSKIGKHYSTLTEFKKYNIPWNRDKKHTAIMGSKNPNWQGGKSFEEYGKDFDNNLKELVRFRNNYRCFTCGCSQIENYRQLDVHHIDYDKKNSKLENLIPLCHSCHLKTNHKRNYWKNYFMEKLQYASSFIR